MTPDPLTAALLQIADQDVTAEVRGDDYYRDFGIDDKDG